MYFSLGNARFIDSLKFLNCNLGELVQGLDNVEHEDGYFDDGERELIRRKGVYPYEYMDSITRFGETSLPPIEAFDSTFNVCMGRKSVKLNTSMLK